MKKEDKKIIGILTAVAAVGTLVCSAVSLIHRADKKENVKLFYFNKSPFKFSPDLLKKIKSCCEAALEEEGITQKAEVSLTLVTNEEIKALNREHRGKDSVTDVLSFPMSENYEFDIDPQTNRIILGDIVISAQKAMEQAREYGHSLEREMCFLATHSMFHLLGYDHEVSAEEEAIMFDKQERVMKKLGINR